MKFRLVVDEMFHAADKRTDITKLIVAFRSFANASGNNILLQWRQAVATYSEIRTKHINTRCGRKVEILLLNWVAYNVAVRIERLEICFFSSVAWGS
jgi:hypothetical protein